jgi:hypothetical protein
MYKVEKIPRLSNIGFYLEQQTSAKTYDKAIISLKG